MVARTHESSSMAQLDGSDIVYVARVSVPKIIALRVDIGTRFPAERTSQGKVLLAALTEQQVTETLAHASRSGLPPQPAPPATAPTPSWSGSAPRGGRWPTRSSPRAYGRWPPRCGTPPARSGRR